MIDLSTNVRAALRRRQRGFLLNPFRFGGGGGGGGGSDPYWDDVLTLLHMTGANASTDFPDATGNLTWTANGGAQISTAQSKWGGGSGSFDATDFGQDYLTTAYDSDTMDWWTDDFTVEAWVRPTSFFSENWLIGNMSPTSAQMYWSLGFRSTGKPSFFTALAGVPFEQYITGPDALSTNEWHHIAMSYASGTVYLAADGSIVASAAPANTPASYSVLPLSIGGYRTYSRSLNGFVNDARITRGVARYTASYSVPDAEFPDA